MPRPFFALVLAALFASSLPATPVDELITKARSRLGKERTLATLQSLHFRGTVEIRDDTGTILPEASGQLEMILRRPAQQLNIRTAPKLRDTVGLDDLTGWQRTEFLDKPDWTRTQILSLDELRRLQAVTAENLYFYRAVEQRGGSTELRGEQTIDGRSVVVAAFKHPHGITYTRYFDRETGELVLTEDPTGAQVREEGEQTVAGIRFPQRVRSAGRTPDGKRYEITISFSEITVNERFADDLFAVPMPGTK